MSERKDLLSDLLSTPPENVDDTMQVVQREHMDSQPETLTERDEQALMRAANAVGPVTLSTDSASGTSTNEGVVQDIAGFVRRYPIPTALAVAGAAYLLARRGRR